MLTRRVRGRQLRLRPSPLIDQIVGYVLAVMLKKHRLRLHALIVMGNHWHLVVTDLFGNVPDFRRDCHSFIARAINRYHGDFESMWAHTQGSQVACEEPSDTINKIAYTMANPVEDRLVRYGHHWPGLRVAWPHKPLTFKRPAKFFRGPDEGGTWPDEATLELSRPPGYDELSDDELADAIKSAVKEREELFRAKYDAEGKRFLGRRAILRQSRYDYPNGYEPRFGISPRVASRNKWRRIEKLQQQRRWQDAYAAALPRWRAGDRNVVFPYGTYKMRILHNVRCADGPV